MFRRGQRGAGRGRGRGQGRGRGSSLVRAATPTPPTTTTFTKVATTKRVAQERQQQQALEQTSSDARARRSVYMTADDARFLASQRRDNCENLVLNELIGRIQKEIRVCASKTTDNIDLFYKVPSFLPDYPLFDQALLAHQLRQHFQEQQFFVEVFRDQVLYINWDTA